jgi:glutathione reductase (NADPH)
LPGFGELAGRAVAGAARSRGVDLRTEREVIRISPSDRPGRFAVTTRPAQPSQSALAGQEETHETDLVVHAAGRRPDLDALGVDELGLETRTGRLAVDDRLRTTRHPETVLAVGDAAALGRPLTPVASAQASVVVGQLLGRNDPRFRAAEQPTVAFTHPPAAQVGARADELADALRAGEVERRAGDASGWQTAERAGETVYAYEVLLDRGSNALRGATVVGPQAEETIHLFALAMAEGIPASRLAALLPAFPTAASDLSALLRPDT